MTRKRVCQVALQRSDALRGAFMVHCSIFSRDKFVWVDETGADTWDHIRRYGYAIRGIRPVTHRFMKRGTRVNAIAGFSPDGPIALELTSGSVNEVDFVRGTLIPVMMSFHGVNPRSILVMDNCTIHHVKLYYFRQVWLYSFFHHTALILIQLKKFSAMLRVISRNMTNCYKQEPLIASSI